MDFVNGEMDLCLLKYDQYGELISKGYVGDRAIDIGANLLPRQLMDPNFPNIKATQTCLVLPYKRKIALEDYGWCFHRDYSILAFSSFCFAVYTVIKRIADPHAPFTLQLYRTIRLLSGHAITSRMFRRLRLPEKILEVSTHIYTVIIVSLVISTLTTTFIVGMQQPEIVDAETFLASGLRIMVYHEQLDSLFEHIPRSLEERVELVDLRIWAQNIYSLNDSYAYVMMTHQWRVTNFRQQRLLPPKLRLGPEKLCGVPQYLRFYIRPGLYYVQVLHHFLMQMHESGISEQWIEIGLRQAKQFGLLAEAPYEPNAPLPLPLGFFKVYLKTYVYGILLSLAGFLMEWIYFYCRSNDNIIIVE